jgi:flagellin FlaB
MNTRLYRAMKNESGITALETAIILIAFVVVAAIFAFTVLSTGTFLTERSKEAAYAGLQEVRGSLEIRGSVIISGTADTTGQDVACDNAISDTVSTAQKVYFTLANVAGGQGVDLTDTAGKQVTNVSYRDKYQNIDLNGNWSVSFIGKNNSDKILEPGELAQVEVTVTGLTCKLGPNTTFGVEVKPPQGGVLLIERTTPARIDTVTDLH